MALAKMLGFDLCPRLKSFRDRRLHVPRHRRVKIPEALKTARIADVSLEAIVEGAVAKPNFEQTFPDPTGGSLPQQ